MLTRSLAASSLLNRRTQLEKGQTLALGSFDSICDFTPTLDPKTEALPAKGRKKGHVLVECKTMTVAVGKSQRVPLVAGALCEL